MSFDLDAAKTCKKCGVEKKVADFYFNKKKGYYYTTCKACESARGKTKPKRAISTEKKGETSDIRRAKCVAEKVGLGILSPARNGSTETTVDDYGGYMIINTSNGTVVAGERFDLYPEQVYKFVKEVADDRGVIYGKELSISMSRSKRSKEVVTAG